ncbi:MAG: glycosyltransferase family 39 protein [Candidatus Pacebacteria bacterium]|nr:glycosyltransferase family 39 protein [Candidatus Paceibacterota bacterium]
MSTAKLKDFISKPLGILTIILMFAFLVRIAGINYGLPLWVYDDEPPFTLSALKMIQLKSLIPALHMEDFAGILYYPPYLSYLYMPFFSVLVGLKYLSFGGDMGQFADYLGGDLSGFFLIARFLNVLIGVASVWLIYRIAKSIFNSERAGLIASFLTATSLYQILMSSNGRHWLAVSFFILLGLFFLTNRNFSFKKRYGLAILTMGAGLGVSPIIGLLGPMIIYWYLFYDRKPLKDFFGEKYFYFIIVAFLILAALPAILYPAAFGFRGDLTAKSAKTILGAAESPFLFAEPVALSEPILTLFAVGGLVYLLFKRRSIFWPFLLFIYTYSISFYMFFRYEHRFAILFVPIFAILAAGILDIILSALKNKVLKAVLLLILVAPLVFSVRLGYLMFRDDSRILAINWARENIPAGAKVITYARAGRIPSDKESIGEQRLLDPSSLRKVDIAEEKFGTADGISFHALNLYLVNNPEFFNNLEKYVSKNKYQYLIATKEDLRKRPEIFSHFQNLMDKSELVKYFEGSKIEYSPSMSQIWGSPLYLFGIKELGPATGIYKLK